MTGWDELLRQGRELLEWEEEMRAEFNASRAPGEQAAGPERTQKDTAMIDEELYEAVRGCISGGEVQWDDVYNELVTAQPAALALLIDALEARLRRDPSWPLQRHQMSRKQLGRPR